jgi:hypothetical protein
VAETLVAPLPAPAPAVAETLVAPLPAPAPAVAETLVAPLPAPAPAVAETLVAPLPAPAPAAVPEAPAWAVGVAATACSVPEAPAWAVGVAATVCSVPEAPAPVQPVAPAAALPAETVAGVATVEPARPGPRRWLLAALITLVGVCIAAAGILWTLGSRPATPGSPGRSRPRAVAPPDAGPPPPDAARAPEDARPARAASDAAAARVDARADATTQGEAARSADAAVRPLSAAEERRAGLLRQAREALASGKVADARRAIRTAQNQKDSAEANDLLAQTYERSGDDSTALYYARQAVALDAREPAFTLRLARLLLRAKRRGEACRLARAVLARQPGSADARALETEACEPAGRP